jgi:hypothetical protein
MKKQQLFSPVVITGIIIYAIGFIATSKQLPTDPCTDKLYKWWYTTRDTGITNHNSINFYNDSVFCYADTTYATNWNNTTDSICKFLKDSCFKTSSGIIVLNLRDTARTTWDNKYGKKIFFKRCT